MDRGELLRTELLKQSEGSPASPAVDECDAGRTNALGPTTHATWPRANGVRRATQSDPTALSMAHIALIREYCRALALTPREEAVFFSAVQGHGNKASALHLGVAPETIRRHWASICRKARQEDQKLTMAHFARVMLTTFVAVKPAGDSAVIGGTRVNAAV
jgi:DNA-binding CsgD family transcriptional regulator